MKDIIVINTNAKHKGKYESKSLRQQPRIARHFKYFHQQAAEVVTCSVLSQNCNYADRRVIIIIIRLKLHTVDQAAHQNNSHPLLCCLMLQHI